MYKILIVDDEHIVQLALKSLIQWERLDCEIVALVANGKEAIEQLKAQTIDVVITDINMPIMNGIDLIKWIKEQQLPIHVIVLSAYNDYEYVRSAFKFGVEDYILKSEMDPEVVTDMVRKLLEKKAKSSLIESQLLEGVERLSHLDSSNSSNTSNAQNTSMSTKSLPLASKNLALFSLLESRIDTNLDTLHSYFSNHELDIQYHCYVLLIDDFSRIINQYDEDELEEFTKHVLDTIKGRINPDIVFFVLPLSSGEYCLIVERLSKLDRENRQKINTLLKSIQISLETYMNIHVTMGAYDIDFKLGKLKSAYDMAKECAELRYIYGKGRIIYPEDARLIKQTESKSIIGSVDPLLHALQQLDQIQVDKELDILLNAIGSYKGKSLQGIIGHYMELLLTIIINLRNMNNDLMDAFDHQTDFYKFLSDFDTKEELHQWLKNFVKNLMLYMIDNAKNEVSSTILQSKKYIDLQYSIDISLAMVAQNVGLSEAYLSKLFVKETGETFIQYLTKKRITKACEMLRMTSMKIYEIAEKVGYENVEHFSRVFKKVIGVSPNQYKRTKTINK
jgi:two-component system, response regulator YesN